MKNTNRKRSFQIMLIVTHACNLNCVYCYESIRQIDISVNKDSIKSIISSYLNSDEYDEILIEFFGGEPWLKKDLIIEICEWTWSQKWKNDYRFFTSTNGTLIHGEIQNWLHLHNKQISCGLSLDGIPSIHNLNRSNSFNKIDLEFFRSNWPNQPVKMTIAPNRLNYLAECIIYIHQLGFKIAGTNFAEGFDWSHKECIGILCQELKRLVNFYLDNPQVTIAPILNIPIENCECAKTYIPNKYCAARSLLAYDVDGKAFPCNFFTPMTFPKDKLDCISISDFYQDDNLIDKYCYDNCYFYSVCPNCYGSNYLMNGSISERDKSKCNLIKLQCYYSAALQAQLILRKKCGKESVDIPNLSNKIKAIKNIKAICEAEFAI